MILCQSVCYTDAMKNSVQTLLWYDLETSGIDPRGERIMQFAGQRTDLALNMVGEPINLMIKYPEDKLPQPDAVFITGITPQMTLADGLTEVEFLKYFTEEVAVPGTVFVGYNTVRFDDEFMRFLHFRNYYDAYSWEWRDGRGRWDLLDVVRMTRALRPDGIKWPMYQGKASNRLELLTKANGVSHESAHDALSDVLACIEVARLIKTKQPKLFEYLLDMRDKKKVATLVEAGQPFMYASGKYSGEYEKTTAAVRLAANPHAQGSLVYDLRVDPTEFVDMTPEQLAKRWEWTRDESAPSRLPIKTMQYNRCPAVAPLGVLDEDSKTRLQLDNETIRRHHDLLQSHPAFTEHVLKALEVLEVERQKRPGRTVPAEEQLYDGGFMSNEDQTRMSVLRAAQPAEIVTIAADFQDDRLREMAVLYKARNFPQSLTDDERTTWEQHRYEALMAGGADSTMARFMHRLQELSESKLTGDKKFLLEELQLYAESIMPAFE